jgi:hypothetical protein
MRHRLPLLRPLSILVVLFVLTAVAVFGLLRFDRVVTATGRFAGPAGGGAPTRFEGWLDDHGRVAVRDGQPVTVRVDALPWLKHGTVPGRVASVGAFVSGSGFAVVISLEAADHSGVKVPAPLAIGMAGQARIRVGAPVTMGRLLFERLAGGEQP